MLSNIIKVRIEGRVTRKANQRGKIKIDTLTAKLSFGGKNTKTMAKNHKNREEKEIKG